MPNDEERPPEQPATSQEAELFETVGPAEPPPSSALVPGTRWSGEIVATQTAYIGPIPPAMLREFNEIDPGLAREIIQMSKDEASHRREIEKEESLAARQIAIKEADTRAADMRLGYWEARIGQFCALAIGLALTAAATYTAVHQAQITGALLGASGLTTIISTFLVGRNPPKKQPPQPPRSDGSP